MTRTPAAAPAHPRCRSVAASAIAAVAVLVSVAAPAHADSSSLAGDDFAAPIVISGIHGTITAFNSGATAELDEAAHAQTPSGAFDRPDHSIWFKWTAPGSGHVTFRTRDSDFDTVMAAYAGPALVGLNKLASNDDTDMVASDGVLEHSQSQVNFKAVKGKTYRIAVDSFTGSLPPEEVEQGTIVLSWNANDDFAGAQVLTGPNGGVISQTSGDVTGATTEAQEPLHAGRASDHSIWYEWTAPKSGTVTFDTLESNFDTLLAAYTGPALGKLTEVASSDDTETTRSKITFRAKAGKTYRIAVAGFADREGLVVLNFRFGS